MIFKCPLGGAKMSSSSHARNQKIEQSIKWIATELDKEWKRIGDNEFKDDQVISVNHIRGLNESIKFLKSHIKQFI